MPEGAWCPGVRGPFDRLRVSGGKIPFGLSLSKSGVWGMPFDRLRANGGWAQGEWGGMKLRSD